MTSLMRLGKYHGLGNDFLVLLDPAGSVSVSADFVRALCHRTRGAGADGLIRASRDRASGRIRMELYNSDGTQAEMSGNGIRCLAHALLDAGWVLPGRFEIDTAAGTRALVVRSSISGLATVEVDMGQVLTGPPHLPETMARPPARAVGVEVGNPHLVILVEQAYELSALPIERLGPSFEIARPGGQNVEWVRVVSPEEIEVRIWERGAGVTEACGSGSVAAAAACRYWGMTSSRVMVHNPGGDLEVILAPAGAKLVGPSARVGTFEIAGELLERMGVLV
jgi:diaminopimelate epimerase